MRARHALLSALLCLSMALGCTTQLDRAQAGTTAAARVLASTDLQLAQAYAAEAEAALAEAMTLEGYREKIRPWDRVEQSLRLTKAGLLAMQSALDIWEATGEDPGFTRVVACFVAEARDLVRVVELAAPDFDISAVKAVAPLLAAFAGGVCHE